MLSIFGDDDVDDHHYDVNTAMYESYLYTN